MLSEEEGLKSYGRVIKGLGGVKGWKQRGESKPTPIKVSGIHYPSGGDLHNTDKGVIYVFPKFIGPDKQVLPVQPAVFDPPGAYAKELFIKIGVDQSDYDKESKCYGQYIENKTKRELHGKSAVEPRTTCFR